jgi:hypothetical protein
VIANLLGVNKLNNAYGLLSLCQGIAVIIGSPLAGLHRIAEFTFAKLLRHVIVVPYVRNDFYPWGKNRDF